MRSLFEEPSAMTVPESFLCIVGVLVRVRPGMVSDMIGTPEQRRVLQRPTAGNQQADLHPRTAFEAPMRNHSMVAHSNPETGDDVEHGEKRPVELTIVIKIRKKRDT